MARLIGLVLVAALAAAGCGSGDDQKAASDDKPVGRDVAGSVVQFADCGDWRKGTPDERMATVVALRGQLTPTQSKTAAGPLPDERAYELLDRTCKVDFAESMRLYKLYVRAQGFAPLSG